MFDHHWELKLPNFSRRKSLFETLISQGIINIKNEEVDELASRSENFTTANMDLVVKRSQAQQSASAADFIRILNEVANKTYKTTR